MKGRLVAPIALVMLLAALPARADPPDPDPFFGRDKALHFGFSAALAGAGYGFSAMTMHGRANHVAFGAAVAISAGYTKEVLDAAGFGAPSWKDFAWDVIGTAVGLGVSLAIDYALSEPRAARAPSPAR